MMDSTSQDRLLERVVRIRPDIEWSLFSNKMPQSWVARDPVSLEYFHFSALEKSIANLFDGTVTLAQVLAGNERLGITAGWLIQLVSKLENACLCVPAHPSAGRRLWQGKQLQRKATRWQKFLSPIAIRVRLFDPTSLLNSLAWCSKFLFSWPFVVAWLLCALPLSFWVFLECLESPGKLFSGLSSLTTEHAITLVIVYAIVKSLHELGHALACKRWNAECHEIGLLFLVFMPILYCDVSDSWKLASRWRRASVPLAGIYVELVLATIASGVWLVAANASLPSLIAANTIVICSLNTVLVNANPLLRYDGYYALSDLWGVPNLAQQGKEAAWATSQSFVTSKRLQRQRWDASPKVLAVYGTAAWLYRNFVVVLIGLLVWGILNKLGLGLLAFALVSLLALNTIGTIFVGLNKWIWELVMSGPLRIWGKLRLSLLLAFAAVGGFCFFRLPLPTYVTSRGVTEFADLTPVYAKQMGTLESFADTKTQVAEGTSIVKLNSVAMELQRTESAGQVDLLEQRMRQLEVQSVDSESAATELANTAAELAKERDRLQILESELGSLITIAESNGKLIESDYEAYRPLAERPNTEQTVPVLHETVLGRRVERGHLLGWFQVSEAFELTAYVSEQDAELLWEGMAVRCRWDCESSTRYDGRVLRIAPEPIQRMPVPLVGDGSLAAKPSGDSDMALEPAVAHYEVAIAMKNVPKTLSHRSLATVHFETSPRTLSQSIKRLIDLNIRPDL